MQPPPQPTVQPPAPTHTIVIQAPAPPGPRIYERYHHKQARILGWSQITIGLVSILCWSLAIYFDTLDTNHAIGHVFSVIGAGIWCGLFFLLPGAFGVASAGRKTMCSIVAFMVLSILSLVLFDLYYIGWSGAALGIALNHPSYDCSPYNYFFDDDYLNCKQNPALVAMYAICVTMALSYVIISIWSSVICCMAVCCGTSTNRETAVQYVTAEGQVLLVQGGTAQQGVIQQYPQQQNLQQQQYPQQQNPQPQQYPQQQNPQPQYPQQQFPQQQYPQQQYPQQVYPQQVPPQQQHPQQYHLQQQYSAAYHGQVPSAPEYPGHSSSDLPPPYGSEGQHEKK